MAAKRAAFSSARIMRSFRNSAESTRSADANGAQMECNGKDKDKDKERNRCGQKVQTDIVRLNPPLASQNIGAPSAIAMVTLLRIRRYLMSV
jgi:hypothetical protein